MMKIFSLVFAAAMMVSCSVSDDPGTQTFASTIEDVTMASAYKVDSTSHIMIKYKRPSDCYIFNGFYADGTQFTKNVAVRFVKMNDNNCEADETVYQIPYSFTPTAPGTYLFRFWNSRDAQGVDTYIEREAIVP